MSTPSPEWISITIVDATLHVDDGAQAVKLHIGLVRMPGAGVQLACAAQTEGGPLTILPPHSVAQIIGALRAGLSQM